MFNKRLKNLSRPGSEEFYFSINSLESKTCHDVEVCFQVVGQTDRQGEMFLLFDFLLPL